MPTFGASIRSASPETLSMPMPKDAPHLTRGDDRDELIATVALLRAEVLSPTKLSALLEDVGSAVDLLPISKANLGWEARPLLLDAVGEEHVAKARQEVVEWEAAGLDARTLLHQTYPTSLQGIFDKPPLLFVSGAWDEQLDSRAVAVVGTRTSTPEGCRRAYRLAHSLAEAGVTVISGLARGIDTCAHQGALRAGGRTVAVMGTGITKRYPKENAPLADAIVESGGALISQFFPAQPPTKWTFPVRNVTMSGLTLATIVVEAGATSGAKMQAEAALTHGRAVFLPSSLVAAHPWARAMIEKGFRGAHAIEISSPEQVTELLDFSSLTLPSLSA
ncbi:MAG: DNA-processing protein DprA [Rubrobacteraceae bacterium]